MKIHLFAFTLILGVVLAVHLAMNAKVGSAIGNPRVGNALTAVIIGLTGWKAGALAPLKDVNLILLTAGALGAMLVFAIVWLIPEIGAGSVMIILLAGQVIGGLAMSHFGWLGSPVEPINWLKILGVALMIGGVVLATLVKLK